MMEVEGKVFYWVWDYLDGREIQVRIRKAMSLPYGVENGTLQGCMMSPLLFSVIRCLLRNSAGQWQVTFC